MRMIFKMARKRKRERGKMKVVRMMMTMRTWSLAVMIMIVLHPTYMIRVFACMNYDLYEIVCIINEDYSRKEGNERKKQNIRT